MMKRPLVVFDMDGVLIHHRSSWRIVHDAIGTSNEHSFKAYMKGEIDDKEFMKRDIQLWKEKGVRTLDHVEAILASAKNMEGLDHCIGSLKGSGSELAILSGGVDLLANRLGGALEFTYIFANGLSSNNGELTGEGVLRVPLRDKGSVLRSLLSREKMLGPVVAIGDSPVDITMFREADLSIAFRPESEIVSDNADLVINEPDLALVSDAILRWLKKRDGSS